MLLGHQISTCRMREIRPSPNSAWRLEAPKLPPDDTLPMNLTSTGGVVDRDLDACADRGPVGTRPLQH